MLGGGRVMSESASVSRVAFFWYDRKERATARAKEVDIPEDERRLVRARSGSQVVRLGAAGNKRRWFFRVEVERRAEDGRQHAHAASPPADGAAAHEDGEGMLARVFRAHRQTRMSGGG